MIVSSRASLLLLALFGAPQQKIDHVRLGPWSIERAQDRFTGLVSCKATRGALTLVDELGVIHLGARHDVSQSLYRLDDGPVQSIGLVPENDVYHAHSIRDAPYDNPSAGIIAIPIADLKDHQVLWIRIDDHRSPVRVLLSGLAAAEAQESAMGCALAS
jgi:hypothetical protein